MSAKKIVIPVLILVASVIGFSLLKGAKKPPEVKPLPDSRPVVKTLTAELTDYQLVVRSQGVVEALNKTALVSQVSGQVTSFNPAFNAGGFVKAGEALIQIEPFDYQSSVKTAESNLAKAQAALEEEEARAKVALDDWQRAGRAGSAPLLGLRKPQLAREKANVLSAEAELDRARRNLSRTTIRAPYNAIVSQRQVDIGQYISTGAMVGEVLATDVAEVRLPISSAEYTKLKRHKEKVEQNPVRLSILEGNSSWIRQAVVVRDEGIISSQNRQIYIVAQVNQPYESANGTSIPLRFGQFVSAEIEGPLVEDVSRIPLASLHRNQYVFVVTQDNKLEKRSVTIVDQTATEVIVSDGIKPGELIMSSKLSQPIDGMAIKLFSEVATEIEPTVLNAKISQKSDAKVDAMETGND
jgi:RND family efflux transporter MFP subunit